MTVRTEVTRIENNVANAYLAAASKGANLPATQNIANLASTITSIPAEDTSNLLCNYDVVLSEVEAYGKCEQASTPTPQSPQNIVCNNGVISIQKNNLLPAGYTQLDYLGFSGTQYIETGFYVTYNTRAEGDFYINSGNYGRHIFGSYDTDKYFRLYLPSGSVSNKLFDAATFTPITSSMFDLDTRTHLRLDNTGAYIGSNTTTYTNTPDYFAADSELTLGKINGYTGNQNYLIGRVYYFEVYESGVLVRKFIPAMRNSDSALGMYDILDANTNTAFHTNAGTGDFTYGSTIPRVPDTIITTGTQETITDAVGNTSTCERLLSVGDYADIQEIIDGTVIRKVGVLVLDGTENWAIQSGTYPYFCVDYDTDFSLSTNNYGGFCSHFQCVNTGATQNNQGISLYKSSGTNKTRLGLKYNDLYPATTANIPLLKQWLANQYNAGTPVIIVYPLATTTTESITPQTQLTTMPLTVTGSLNNLVVDPYKEMIASNINLTNKFTGIEKIQSGFDYLFTNNQNITGDLSFTSLETISGSVDYTFSGTRITSASFPALTSMTGSMSNCFSKCNYMQTLTFGALQSIIRQSGQNYGPNFILMASTNNDANPALTGVYFPVLETIGINCNYVFQYAFEAQKNLTTVSLPVLSGIYSDYVFDGAFINCTGLQTMSFPSLTTIGSGKSHIFNNAFDGCTNLAEIHFKASIQSAIESQSGYSSRWGATNATIYFDL